MTLELGDHVWYWNSNISLDKDIPRADWFPGSNPGDATDYQGHGTEIYNFVIHADEIARGRPQMLNYEGSFSWLDNNPGNITGRPGGPDFGQYPNKFNWHNFLIFPTWQAGYDAIAQLLRSSTYVDLSILDAFKKYAPESDGNNPVAYANAVANYLQVPVSTIVGDLDDTQMLAMQDKITEIEGPRAGASLSWDSDEIPPEIADLLPKSIRQARRPRMILPRGGPFSIAISAPVDPSGFTSGLGGPNQGDHVGPNWYNQFGMDLGAKQDTPVYAAFDGHITRFKPHVRASDNIKEYGAQIFMRAPNDMMGGFYTHLTDVPKGLGVNSTVARGDLLGRVFKFQAVASHLHLALVEIIGGAPGGQYLGVDIYPFFLDLEAAEPDTVVAVEFNQDGSPPEPVWRAARVGVFLRGIKAMKLPPAGQPGSI
jgi:murein DD-endopeptidase MepM/ murein hydrolase activator NlpD